MDGRTWLLKNTKDQLVMKGHEKGMGPVVAVSTVAATISVCRHESLYMSVK